MTRILFSIGLIVLVLCLVLSVFGLHFNLRGFVTVLSQKQDWKTLDVSKITKVVDSLKIETDYDFSEPMINWSWDQVNAYFSGATAQTHNYLIDAIQCVIYAGGVMVNSMYFIMQVLNVLFNGDLTDPDGFLPLDPDDYPFVPIDPPEVELEPEPS